MGYEYIGENITKLGNSDDNRDIVILMKDRPVTADGTILEWHFSAENTGTLNLQVLIIMSPNFNVSCQFC